MFGIKLCGFDSGKEIGFMDEFIKLNFETDFRLHLLKINWIEFGHAINIILLITAAHFSDYR